MNAGKWCALVLVLAWASWLGRYSVTMGTGAPGPDGMANAVRLDRWTGNWIPLNAQLWMQTEQGRMMWPGSIPPDAIEWWQGQVEWLRKAKAAEKSQSAEQPRQ